ncbi:hypothetical protein PAMA_013559 [Pampus argenteus]
MPLTVRNSALRRRKTPSEKLLVMAPTRMKLRIRRRDNAAGGAAGGVQPEEEEERNRESSSRSSRRKNTRNTSTTAAAATSSTPPSSSASASARAVLASEDASPDSKCPICLDRFNNLAYLDRCLHRFCFPCIQEWSHNKAECPLCKQPFASILHSVRAEDDFKEYTLRPAPANSSVAATVAMVAAMASAARSDHQMRLMLRRHRAADGGETTLRRRRRDRGGRGGGGRRAGERTGVWEWYLDSPPLPPLPHHPAVSPVVAEDSEEGEDLSQQRGRGGAGLAERGVIFEGLTGLTGAVAPVAPNDRASRRLMTSLVRRQRLQREGGTVRRMRERETVAFRRGLYRNGIRVRGVAGVNGNQGQQQRDITAESFRRTPTHLNRLRPWLRRELTVLYGAHNTLVDIVQRIIMARLARHGLEDMPTIEEELRPFLLARTDHFLHELVSFARSPLSLENYDLQAMYEPPAAAMDLDGISSSSDSSSVIAISEGEEEGRAGAAVDDHIQTGSCLSLSAWDDETPGPSYSTVEPSCSLASLSFSPATQETANEEGGEKEEGEEECLIVGYKKPIAERTPELVQLSSDTEEEEKKEKEEDTAEKPLPLSYLPTIPPSTSGAYREEEKDVEVGGLCSRAQSWSGSSGSGQDSVCTLSPATPGGSERRQGRESWRDEKQQGSEEKRRSEKRRRKRRRRDREQSRDWLRKSGTLYNPNRSIYPAMMRRRSHSPSPFNSSMESGSPLPPSPPDSSWEYCCSQVSPLTSSVSSPSRSSASPLCSSPQPSSPLPQTPPTPSLSPSDRSNLHHGEKPGGKRKYKSRHLDSDDKDPSWRPSGSHRRVRRRERGEKESRRRVRDGGRRRETTRRDGHRESAGCSGESMRCREDRSPSVEIIYEGTVTSDATQPPTRNRRRKRHRKTQHSSSQVVIITLDSNSSHDDDNNKINSSNYSSPLSSQQTVDFSDLPPLPLVPSTGVGGAMDEEIGELPVNILDRGSDGSEIEPVGQSKAADHITSDNSDQDVDVENVEEGGSLMGCIDDDDKPANMHGPIRNADTKTTTGSAEVIKATPALVDGENDSRLLATVLSNLEVITAPKCELSSNSEPKCSPDTRKQSLVVQCEGRQAQTTRSNPGFHEERRCSDGASFPLPPPLQQLKECRVREEEVPPLLKQASPVQSYNRNTPPPLKHKDAGSPRLSPISPVDLHPPDTGVNPTVSRVDSAKDKQAVPPVSTLKKHFTSTLAVRREIASTSSTAAIDMHSSCHLATVDSRSAAPSDVGASTVDIHSMSHKSPIDSHSSGSNADRLPHLDFSCFSSSQLHSSHASTKVAPSSFHKSSPTQLHPVNSLSAIDFHLAKERPAHINSTSSGHGNKSVWIAPIDLNPSSSAFAVGTLTGSDVFSGANSNDASLPVCVSSIGSHFSSNAANREKLSERLSPSRVSSGPLTTPSGRLAPIDVHPRSPKSPVDLQSSGEGQTDIKASSVVSHEDRSPLVDLHVRSPAPPVNLHSSSFVCTTIEGHLNHTAISSVPTENSWTKCSSESEPIVESKPPHTTDSDPKSHNHFDPGSDTCSDRRLPVDSHSKHPQRDFNHITSSPESVENQWDSSVDQRLANTVWNTHTRLK